MADFNELSLKILSEKYFASGETHPDQLFKRVAASVALSDLLYKKTQHAQDRDSITLSTRRLIVPNLNAFYLELENYGFGLINTIKNLEKKGLSIEQNSTEYPNNVVPFLDDFFNDKVSEYLDAMLSMDFMPGTPTLINAGRKIGMLSSCFYIEVQDSMDDIFNKVKDVALISKAGGGVGIGVSKLRPEGAIVKDTNGTSSGPISFLKVFNETGNQVQQGGIRRAALIATLSVYHPDIMKFITCKEEEGTLHNFNLSVLVDDAFMQAVVDDLEITLTHPSVEDTQIPARIIWKKLTEMAHKNGEPGIIFMDRIRKDDIFNNRFGDLGVNPCGEITLLPYESCNLGAINLSNLFVANSDKSFHATFDVYKLKKLVRLGVRFLDNIIDINNYPLEATQEMTEKTRRIGLGTFGLHDLMLKYQIKYGSGDSLELIYAIYSIIKETAIKESIKLGEERGVPEDIQNNSTKQTQRNAGLLAAQPTGTVAMICNQTSSGIEPVFQFEYGRKDSYGQHEIKHFIKQQYSDNLPEFAVTSLDITPKDHIKVQSALQHYIDNSISKTVNLPNSATVADVDAAYKLAWSGGCKSTTVYRSGSRKEEVLSEKNSKVEQEETTKNNKILRERPRVLFGATTRINTPGGKAYITVNEDNDGVREVFIHISKAGSETNTHVESEGRLISNSLKYWVPPQDIIGHLQGHKSNPILDCGKSVKSVPDAVSIALQEYVDNYEGFSLYIEEDLVKTALNALSVVNTKEISGDLCPECGEVLYMAGGCTECVSCGFSRCG